MRIAHIGCKGLPSQGGTERVVEAVATRHAPRHEITVYGRPDVCTCRVVGGVRVLAVSRSRHKYLGPVMLGITSCFDALLRQSYDVVHVHGAENAFIVPLLRLRYPVVTTNHGPAYERAKWGPLARAIMRATERISVRSASRCTAVAQAQADALTTRYRRSVQFVPNGVDAEISSNLDAARLLLEEYRVSGPFVLFAAARVDPTKGCHTLIEAFRLGAFQETRTLVVVGDLWHVPAYEAELRDMARGMRVTFIPRLQDKATLIGLLQSADLFVFPSLVEAMSMMLLEAVSVGVPGIASDIRENTDILPAGYLLFRAGDASDLVRALNDFFGAPRSEMRARAEAYARATVERYDWNVISDQYERIYAELAGSR